MISALRTLEFEFCDRVTLAERFHIREVCGVGHEYVKHAVLRNTFHKFHSMYIIGADRHRQCRSIQCEEASNVLQRHLVTNLKVGVMSGAGEMNADVCNATGSVGGLGHADTICNAVGNASKVC